MAVKCPASFDVDSLREQVHATYTQVTEYFDCFKNTSAEEKVSKDLYVKAVNFFARKP